VVFEIYDRNTDSQTDVLCIPPRMKYQNLKIMVVVAVIAAAINNRKKDILHVI